METLKNAQFVMYCASQFPKIELDEIVVTPATDKLLWVDVALKNDRFYPTISDRSLALKRVKKDKLLFSSSSNISLVEIPDTLTLIDPTNTSARYGAVSKKETEFRLLGKQTKWFRALIIVDGSNGWIEFNIDSKHGGKAKKRVNIKSDD
jgi:hypothetical protein